MQETVFCREGGGGHLHESFYSPSAQGVDIICTKILMKILQQSTPKFKWKCTAIQTKNSKENSTEIHTIIQKKMLQQLTSKF